MKKIIKIFYGFLSIIIISILIFISYTTFFAPKYYTKVITGNTLEADDTNFIKEKFSFNKNERIILFYGYGFNINEGGAIISNQRVIFYLENQTTEDTEQVLYKNIKKITLSNDKDIWKDGIILIKRKNLTEFNIPVVNADYDSKKFYDKINNLIKK